LEGLEDRLAPAAFTVNSLGDTGMGSGTVGDLRFAINQANDRPEESNTISFTVTGTIVLMSSLPSINNDLTITGPGANQLTVRGSDSFRLMSLTNNRTVTISGLTLSGGRASVGSDGGAILQSAGSLTLNGCAFVGNSVIGSGVGGAVFSSQGTSLTISNCTFSGNSTLTSGSALVVERTPTTITNSTFSNNQGPGTIVNRTSGGGDASLTLASSTVANNSDGIWTVATAIGNTATLMLRNTIVANSGSQFTRIASGGTVTIVSLGNNLISDGTLGSSAVSSDLQNTMPLLGTLGNYGGSTQTLPLLPGSPAIDAGSSTGAPPQDQRGINRVGTPDIGAFESRGFTAVLTGGNGQSAIINTNFANPLVVTVASLFDEPVQGGQVTFSGPAAGASATFPTGNPATINAMGQASVMARANDTPGSYIATATVSGAPMVGFSLTNLPEIMLSPAMLPAGAVGSPYNQTITASGGSGGSFTFAVTAGTLPAGLSLAMTGALTGTPTATGTFTFTVTATGAGSFTGNRAYTLTINPAITVSPATLPDGAIGVAYNQTLTATGGAGGPFTFAVTAGTLPTGLSLSAAGVLSGTPTATGAFNFTVTATGAGGLTGSRGYAVRINVVTVNPSTLPDGAVGNAYSQTLTAIGGTGPFTFAVTMGMLPDGLTLSAAGLLSGMPTAAGTFDFTVTATGTGGSMGTRSYMLIIHPAIVVSPDTLPNATVGSAYSQTITATGGRGTGQEGTGGPFTFTVSAGLLPGGLMLAADGLLSGTPTAAGVFNFTIRATDPGGFTGDRAYTLTVHPAVSISPATLPSATVGTAYNQTFTASGGAGGPFTFSVMAGRDLPPGLTLSPAGVLSGTPEVAGTFDFVIVATGAAGATGNRSYSLVVIGPITLSPTMLPAGAVGNAYSQMLTAMGGAGGPFTFAVTEGLLPAGLTLSAAGLLSGTPTSAGTSSFRVTATGADGLTGSQNYTLLINPAVTLSPAMLPAAAVGNVYTQTLTAMGGAGGPFTFAVTMGSLPAGLTLAAGGMLSGTPAASGTFSFTVTATGASGFTGSQAYSLVVNPGVTIMPATLPNATAGSAYNQTLTATGGGGEPFTFLVTMGALPAGLTLSMAGVLSGTPLVVGTFNFTVTATSMGGFTGTRAYTLVVNPGIIITPATLPDAAFGVAYSQTLMAIGGSGEPFMFAVTAGALPAGLTLSPAGVLSGTPTAPGSAMFTVTATDSGGNTAQRAYTLTVAQAPTMTAIAAPNASVVGQSVTFTAVVSSPAGVPTGTVLFALDGGAVVAAPLVNGRASFTSPPLRTGSHTVVAGYLGAGGFASSLAAPATLVVRDIYSPPVPLTLPPNLTPNQRFVSQLYWRLLLRPVDPSGLATYTNLLDRGVSRLQLVTAIQAAPEYLALQVQSAYNLTLNRLADPVGLSQNMSFLAAGNSITELLALLAGSPEFFRTQTDRTDVGYLNAIYRDFLGRPLDSLGRETFLPILTVADVRKGVADVVLKSGEYFQLQVQNFYSQYLGRPADGGGLGYWVGALLGSMRLEQVIAAFLSSPEFYVRS
jgi:hypothetical protein